MKDMVDCLQTYYKARLCKMFVINCSRLIYILWKLVEGFMDPNTREKICLSLNPDPPELLQAIHPDQLMKQYGGYCDPPKEYWPPTFPPGAFRDDFNTDHMTDQEFEKELLTESQLMPSPSKANFVRANRKGKAQKGLVPRKTYRLQHRIERRDSFNGIIPEPGAIPSQKSDVDTAANQELPAAQAKDLPTELKDGVLVPANENVPEPPPATVKSCVSASGAGASLPAQASPSPSANPGPALGTLEPEVSVPQAPQAEAQGTHAETAIVPNAQETKAKLDDVQIEMKDKEEVKAARKEETADPKLEADALACERKKKNNITEGKENAEFVEIPNTPLLHEKQPDSQLPVPPAPQPSPGARATENPQRNISDLESSPAPQSNPKKPTASKPKCNCHLL